MVVCQEVACTFGSGTAAVVAVHGVSATVTSGTRVALTGPSGSGKSTLLHLMAGLETPTAGTVSWPGLGGHPLAVPGRIGVVFQGPSLLPALDVVENVALPLLLADVTEDEATAQAVAALDLLAIGDLARKLPEQLSGGQAQRVTVARALAACPALILADEPTGQLDHEAAALVIEVLLHATTALDAALVVSTHDPLIAQRLPTRWAMRDGTLSAATMTGARA